MTPRHTGHHTLGNPDDPAIQRLIWALQAFTATHDRNARTHRMHTQYGRRRGHR